MSLSYLSFFRTSWIAALAWLLLSPSLHQGTYAHRIMPLEKKQVITITSCAPTITNCPHSTSASITTGSPTNIPCTSLEACAHSPLGKFASFAGENACSKLAELGASAITYALCIQKATGICAGAFALGAELAPSGPLAVAEEGLASLCAFFVVVNCKRRAEGAARLANEVDEAYHVCEHMMDWAVEHLFVSCSL